MARQTSGGNPASEKPRIRLVLTGGEDQHDRWKEYKDEHFGSMAEMVRTSVEREIQGDHMPNPPNSGEGADSEQVGEVLEVVRSMKGTLESLESRVNSLETADETSGPRFDLQKAVFAVLPEAPEDHPVERWDQVSYDGNLDLDQWAATAEELARSLGASPEEVEEVVADLVENTGQVVQAEDEKSDRTYYWRK